MALAVFWLSFERTAPGSVYTRETITCQVLPQAVMWRQVIVAISSVMSATPPPADSSLPATEDSLAAACLAEELEQVIGELETWQTAVTSSIPVLESSGSVLAADWEAVTEELEELQSAVTYEQARGALQTMLSRLNLSAREAAGLESEVQRLMTLLQKLNQGVVQIAVLGLVGRGKSSVLNALVGDAVFATGPIHGVTQTVQTAVWDVQGVKAETTPSIARMSLKGVGRSRLELIDTPGLDEVDGEERANLAQRVATQADLILFVIAGDISRLELAALQTLRDAGKPIILVFNKVDQYPAVDLDRIYATLTDQRLRDLIAPDEIVMVAAAPLVAVAAPTTTGCTRPSIQRGQPQIESLKLKILEVLDREGLSLIALNTLLYANDLHDQIVAKKLQIRDHAAHEVIWNCVMVKAIAIALNPVTLLDVVTGAVVDIAMILTLANLYGLPMTHRAALQLLRNIALELGGLSASELLVTLGLSSLKGILGVSIPATGGLAIAPYTTVAIAQAAVVGVATYGIGQVTKHYLANGAQWGPQGAKTVVTNLLDSLDEASILNRIKTELTTRITRQTH